MKSIRSVIVVLLLGLVLNATPPRDPQSSKELYKTLFFQLNRNPEEFVEKWILGYKERVDWNARSRRRDLTFLQIASQKGQADIVEALILYGAKPSFYEKGLPPLLLAIENGHFAVVKILLENEVDPNVGHSRTKKMPLQIALAKGNIEIALLLILKRANTTGYDMPPRIIEFMKKLAASDLGWIAENYPSLIEFTEAYLAMDV